MCFGTTVYATSVRLLLALCSIYFSTATAKLRTKYRCERENASTSSPRLPPGAKAPVSINLLGKMHKTRFTVIEFNCSMYLYGIKFCKKYVAIISAI